MTVSVGEVRAAAERIAGRVRRTPVVEVSPGLIFKLELLQHTGSFKPRGAFNRLLTAKERGDFVPANAPAPKVAKLRTLDAEVIQIGSEYAEAYQAALQARDESGALLLHAYDQPEVVAGQGTIGLELLEQAGTFDTVLVAVGGGGLIAGIATAIGNHAQVIGVEPELAPTFHRALEAGEPVDGPVGGVAADSLGARRLGDLAFAAAQEYGVRSLLVDEDAIVAARNELWREYHLAVEHGAAVAYAALASGVYRPGAGERVVVVVCGANTDPATLN